jgi:hypothetical protein
LVIVIPRMGHLNLRIVLEAPCPDTINYGKPETKRERVVA